jgi:outer membrane protein insertion porin family
MEQRRLACDAEPEAAPASPHAPEALAELPPSTDRIAAIHFAGLHSLPEAVVRGALHLHLGDSLDAAGLAQDARALSALEVFEDVRIEVERGTAGLVLTYHVAERPFVRRVFVEGPRPADAGTWFFPIPGDVYDSAAVWRAGKALAARFEHTGHLDAAVRTHARRADARTVDLCLALSPGPVYRVRKVAFTGNHVLSTPDLLQALAAGLPESDRAKVNVEGGFFRADLIAEAQLYLSSLAYDRGLLRFEGGEPEVKLTHVSPTEGSAEVTFPIEEGPIFHLAAARFTGALAAPQATYDALLDVHPGEVFSRWTMITVKERAEALHVKLGRKDLVVRPFTDLDADQVRVDFRVEVSP